MKGATQIAGDGLGSFGISIHAPREGSDTAWQENNALSEISIHAPREGSDDIKKGDKVVLVISIHAPREGSDIRELMIVMYLY